MEEMWCRTSLYVNKSLQVPLKTQFSRGFWTLVHWPPSYSLGAMTTPRPSLGTLRPPPWCHWTSGCRPHTMWTHGASWTLASLAPPSGQWPLQTPDNAVSLTVFVESRYGWFVPSRSESMLSHWKLLSQPSVAAKFRPSTTQMDFLRERLPSG